MSTPSKRLIVKSELERIYEERQRLTPADVVDVAAQPGSPLHPFFVWDDNEAGHLYRLAQAAGLIRLVKVRVTQEKAGEVEDIIVRSWIAARASGTDLDVPEGYLPEDEVRTNPALREVVLRQMRREVKALHRRYQHLCEYWALLDELTAEGEQRAS